MKRPPFSAAFFSLASRPDLANDLFRFRHDLFVRELGWQLRSQDERERDEFDTEHAVYCGLWADGEIIGCFRAIPCDRPYLAKQLFPHMATWKPYPVTREYLEISRFGVLVSDRAASASLYSLMVRFALNQNATGLVALADLSHERHLNRIGLSTERYGDCQIVGFREDGTWILAVAGEIPMPLHPTHAFNTLLELTQTMDIYDDAFVFGRERLSA